MLRVAPLQCSVNSTRFIVCNRAFLRIAGLNVNLYFFSFFLPHRWWEFVHILYKFLSNPFCRSSYQGDFTHLSYRVTGFKYVFIFISVTQSNAKQNLDDVTHICVWWSQISSPILFVRAVCLSTRWMRNKNTANLSLFFTRQPFNKGPLLNVSMVVKFYHMHLVWKDKIFFFLIIKDGNFVKISLGI